MQTTQKKEMVRIVDNSKPFKTHEEKQYLICIASAYNDYDTWVIVTGRTEAYEYIKGEIDTIDFKESFVLVENCTLSERKSIYAFMKYASQFFENDDFDIDDYVRGDWSEAEYREDNGIDESINIDNGKRFNIADLLNGAVDTSPLE